MADEHETFIKTPKQLVIAVVLAFVIPITLAVLASQFATFGRRMPGEDERERMAHLIAPVARIELAAGGGAPAGARSGEQVYQSACAACHATAAAGAPKLGDKAAWAPRIATGFDQLVKSANAGKGAMPPKGGNASLTDAEVARAVAYMANQAGANFKAPEAPAQTAGAPPAAAAAAPAPAAPAAAAPAPAQPAAAAAAPAEKAAAPAPEMGKPSAGAQPTPGAAAATPAAPPPAEAGKPDGQAVYSKTCIACHQAGVAGAPKLGDRAAWAPRIAAGGDAMVKSAVAGKGAMPPKGGNPALTDAEVKAAVEYMLAQFR